MFMVCVEFETMLFSSDDFCWQYRKMRCIRMIKKRYVGNSMFVRKRKILTKYVYMTVMMMRSRLRNIKQHRVVLNSTMLLMLWL